MNETAVCMRVRVVFACSRCGSRNYTASKDKAKQSAPLERKKYCSRCRAHTIHRETR